MASIFDNVVNTVKGWFSNGGVQQKLGNSDSPYAITSPYSSIDYRLGQAQKQLDPYITQANKNAQLINWGYNYNKGLQALANASAQQGSSVSSAIPMANAASTTVNNNMNSVNNTANAQSLAASILGFLTNRQQNTMPMSNVRSSTQSWLQGYV